MAGVFPVISGLLVRRGIRGVLMGRFTTVDSHWRLARAEILGFVHVTIVLYSLPFGVEQTATSVSGWPAHWVFTISFVPAVFLIAGLPP